MTVVYMLEGESGQYDAHRSWPVAVYTKEADAEKDCEALNELAQKTVGAINDTHWTRIEEAMAPLHDFDPGASVSDGFLKYTYYQIRLRKRRFVKNPREPKAEPEPSEPDVTV